MSKLEGDGSRAHFDKMLDQLKSGLLVAGATSRSVGKRQVPEREGWAQWVHTRLCIAAGSLIRLAEARPSSRGRHERTLDQTSIAGVARNMIEGAVMIAYIADESLTPENWTLRKEILWLHDATSRYKMFSSWKDMSQADGFRTHIRDIRSSIQDFSEFQALDPERKKKVLSGSEMYIHGLRAAVRVLGWDIEDFNGTYGYLSCHSHSAPVSFMRVFEHNIDFEQPTDAQYAIAAAGIQAAGAALRSASDRIIDLFKLPQSSS